MNFKVNIKQTSMTTESNQFKTHLHLAKRRDQNIPPVACHYQTDSLLDLHPRYHIQKNVNDNKPWIFIRPKTMSTFGFPAFVGATI